MTLRSNEASFFTSIIEFYEKRNYAEAIKWYRNAAERGHAGAQYELGKCYANGDGVSHSYAEAVKWYRKAAAQDHAEAKYNLGVHYASGWGVPEDKYEAVKWYRKAAEQGNEPAQEALKILERTMNERER